MKNIYWLLLMISINGFGQDSAYYIPAFNKADDSLKYELNQLIRNHTEYPYTSSSTDVWDILKDTDRDTANLDNVILIYSGRSVDAAQEYNSGNGWTREHVWAKSRGDFGTSNGPGTDVHHLRPCDNSVNSTRNNRNFDDCVTCVDVIDNGFNTGSKRDANLWTFEPPNEVKGDVARMIFYMAVRYEGNDGEPDLEPTNTLLSNTDLSPLQAVLTTLLEWNRLDTVSDWERNRNQIIYTDYQGNKNPFIDYPEIAEHLWGDSIGVIWKPEPEPADTNINTGIMTHQLNAVKVYPNPTNGLVTITGDVTKIIVFDLHGRKIEIEANNQIINLSVLPQGMYVIQITTKDSVKVVKLYRN